jgi:co-chaperonin GroES (HSP10)
MNIQPTKANVLVEKHVQGRGTTTSPGGVVIFDHAHRDDWHTVRAVGPDCRHVIPGDRVVIPPTVPADLIPHPDLHGRALKFVDEKHIVAKEADDE